jgi:hypothetical protein
MGTGSFPGVKSGRGVTLTTHPLLVTWSRKSRATPLLPLWVVRPVQSLSDCTKVFFTFFMIYFNRTESDISVGHRKWLQEIRICQTDGGITQLTLVTVTLCPKRSTPGRETKTPVSNRHYFGLITPKPAMYLFYESRDSTQFAQRSSISNYVEPSSHNST